MMYKIVISILVSMIPCLLSAKETSHTIKKPIERVIHVGNMTQNAYKVSIKDGNHKYHEAVILNPGCTQYMFCRTPDISLISFQPCKPTGHQFQIDKPLSEIMRVDCIDTRALTNNFHFYLFPNHEIRSFPASSEQDLEIIKEVQNHTFTPPSRPFTSPFKETRAS